MPNQRVQRKEDQHWPWNSWMYLHSIFYPLISWSTKVHILLQPLGRQQPGRSRWAQQHRRLHAESGQCHWPCHGTSGPHSRHHPATPVVWLPVTGVDYGSTSGLPGWTTGQPPTSGATNFWSWQFILWMTMKIGFRDNACPPLLWMHGRGPEESRGISHIPWEANTLDALELSPRSITTQEGLLPIAVPYESCQKKSANYIHGCAHPHWW
jgi:hypothetical protein